MALVVKKDYETNKNKAFTVKNSENGNVHSVIYKGDKKMWSCDCKWHTIKFSECKHIKKAKEYVKKG